MKKNHTLLPCCSCRIFGVCSLAIIVLAALANLESKVFAQTCPAISAPASLNTNAGSDCCADRFPQLASDGAGHWVAVWESGNDIGGIGLDPDILFALSNDNGTNWTTPAALDTLAFGQNGTAPQIATSGGTWVAVWYTFTGGSPFADGDNLSARSIDNGATWGDVTALNTDAFGDSGDDREPQLAAGGAGVWGAVWHGLDIESDVFFTRSIDDGVSWSAPVDIFPASTNTNWRSHIAADGAGTWLAVWVSDEPVGEVAIDFDILCARSVDNGVSWSAPGHVVAGGGGNSDSSTPKIATDGAGTWVTVWVSEGPIFFDSNDDVLAARSTDNGATWSTPVTLTTPPINLDQENNLQITTDAAGNWLVVWDSNDGANSASEDGDVFYVRSTDGGISWTAPAFLNTNATADSGNDTAPAIATDGSGNWLAAWQSDENPGGVFGPELDILTASFVLTTDDCNNNGIPDECDIADATSPDCNSNGKPDECEIDVNSPTPGGPFFCGAGCDSDCNDNGIPDECDIASCAGDPACSDCNSNGIPDGCDLVGNLVGTNSEFFLELNSATGSASAISDVGLKGFESVGAMAFDPNTNTLFGADVTKDQLLRIAPLTGAVTAVGPMGFGGILGLAFDPNTNTLYGTDGAVHELITINTSTGAGTTVGPLGFIGMEGLAFDPNTNTLYGANGATGQLITINTSTGAGTAVGALGFADVRGLAFDPNTNTLFGTDQPTDELITINTTTGAGTTVGVVGSGLPGGLAFDPNNNKLFGSQTGNARQLITINQSTGAGTTVGPLGISTVPGLAFDPNSNTLYGTHSFNDQLITIDTVTGTGRVVGPLGLGVSELAFDPNTNTLYGLAGTLLMTINTLSGAATIVGPLGIGGVSGLAFDANTNTLFGSDFLADQLITINTTTGAGTPVGSLGFANVQGLAFDANTNTLFGSDLATKQLITINSSTGVGTTVGPLGFTNVSGLAFDPNTNTLFGSEATHQLLRIDPISAIRTVVGALGPPSLQGLAYDPNTGTVFATDTTRDHLYTINPLTGSATTVGPLGFANVSDLAFDPNSNTLYGKDTNTNQLITINTLTGAGTAVATIGSCCVNGLAFDQSTNTLFGLEEFPGGLVAINTTTGAITPIGAAVSGQVRGLAFDAATNTLFGTNVLFEQLITINTTTGASTFVGPTKHRDITGLAVILFSNDCNGNQIPDECDIANCAGDPACNDCNSNTIPDECDLVAMTSPDCDFNGVPDECDLSECSGQPACGDCNNNGFPDVCDITLGSSLDVNLNGIPDECDIWDDGAPSDNNWSTSTNWLDDTTPVPGDKVLIDGGQAPQAIVDLDVPATVDLLFIQNVATLNVTGSSGEDLTIAGSGGLILSGDEAASPFGLPKANLLVANDRSINVPNGPVLLKATGLYRASSAKAAVDASINTAMLEIREGFPPGEVTLTDTMSLTTTGDVVMRYAPEGHLFPPAPCGTAGAALRGGAIDRPRLKADDFSSVAIGASLRIQGGANIFIGPDASFVVNGSIINEATVCPEEIDLSRATVTIGSGALRSQLAGLSTFEVAGENRGANATGFTDNFAVGSLIAASGADVSFVDLIDNNANGATDALYVGNLEFGAGSIITIDNSKIYYNNLTDNSLSLTILGSGQLTALTNQIAEPLAASGYPHGSPKNRYLSFAPNAATIGIPHGYEVTHVDSGVAWYISTPRTTPIAVVGEALTFLVSDGLPPQFDFGTLPAVHVGGCLIATGETYEVRAVDSTGTIFSAPLVATSAGVPINGRFWSDIVGAFSVSGNASTSPPTPANRWEPPNGSMNGFDVTAVLRGTDSGDSTRPHITWTDIDGGPSSITNRATNGNDVLRAVNAFATGTGREFYATDHPDVGGDGCPICDVATSGPCATPPLESALLP